MLKERCYVIVCAQLGKVSCLRRHRCTIETTLVTAGVALVKQFYENLVIFQIKFLLKFRAQLDFVTKIHAVFILSPSSLLELHSLTVKGNFV